MQRWKRTIRDFVEDERGQDLIEYALTAALVALGCIVSMHGLSSAISSAFSSVSSRLTSSM